MLLADVDVDDKVAEEFCLVVAANPAPPPPTGFLFTVMGSPCPGPAAGPRLSLLPGDGVVCVAGADGAGGSGLETLGVCNFKTSGFVPDDAAGGAGEAGAVLVAGVVLPLGEDDAEDFPCFSF